jgi:predicted XRE-type DNA-binding protein
VSRKGCEVGSRTVFKDLGIPNAEEHLVKAQLVFKIDCIMKSRRLKQAEAAELLGVKQPDVSKMLRAVLPRAAKGGASWLASHIPHSRNHIGSELCVSVE